MQTVYCPICDHTHKVEATPEQKAGVYICEYCYSINLLLRGIFKGWRAEQMPQQQLDDIKHEQPSFYNDLMTAKRLLMRRNGEQFH